MLLSRAVFSQDYFSYGGGNYTGINQVFSNPAAIADNRLMADIAVTGLDITINNSWFEIKKEALKYQGKLMKPSTITMPRTWKNVTPGVPNNVFKNFSVIKKNKDRAAIVEARWLLPSLMYQLNNKQALAFTWSLRQIGNISGISQQLAYLFENELDLSVTQNTRVRNKNLSAVQMSWAEYGLTWARVLKNQNKHFLKVGITPKLLQGLEASYFIVKELDFFLSSKDNSSFLNSNFSYARSANTSSPFKDDYPLQNFYHYVTKPSLGLDLGVVYEWRPEFTKFKYKGEDQQSNWRKDQNKYRLKLGAAITDIGRIKFKKAGVYYDMNVEANHDDFVQLVSSKDYRVMDSILRANYSNKYQTDEFAILLPTALNTQMDYRLNKDIYINLSTHLSNFFKNNYFKVYNYSAICFAPRYEQFWYDISMPLTINMLSVKRGAYITPGLNFRLGSLSFGTSDVITLFKGDKSGFNFYAMLKVSVPYRLITDQDGDGVPDRKDECPNEAGNPVLRGCPDKDNDLVPDKYDKCPNQPGTKENNGCAEKSE